MYYTFYIYILLYYYFFCNLKECQITQNLVTWNAEDYFFLALDTILIKIKY